MMQRAPKNRRGIFLIEMLFVLSTLTVVMLLATRLFSGTFKTLRQTAAANEPATRFELAMNVLRADIRFSTATQGTNHIDIQEADGTRISWVVNGNELVRTVAGQSDEHWDLSQSLQFTSDGPVLLIRPIAEGGSPIAVASQTTLVQEAFR